MKKILILMLVIVLLSSTVYALTEADIVFPVEELGDCSSEQECKIYCDDNEHIEECLDFGERYNLMSAEELREARQVMEFIKSGDTPGGCVSKTECDVYCDKEENLNECVDFAVRVGFISAEEAEMAKRTGGKGPGGCKREECETYCDKEENMMTCIEFAYEYGMMTAEEYEMVKRTGGKGPGDCHLQGRDACDTYCDDPANMKTCMEFAIEYGLMPEEELERMKNMGPGEECMMNCIMDSGINPDSCGGEGGQPGAACQPCVDECMEFFDHGQEGGMEERMQDMSEDERCMAECLMDMGITPGSCSGDDPECRPCAENCFEMPRGPGEGEWEQGSPEGYDEGMGPPEDYEGEMPPEEYQEPPEEETPTEEPVEESEESSEDQGEVTLTGGTIRGGTSNNLFAKIKEFFENLFNERR